MALDIESISKESADSSDPFCDGGVAGPSNSLQYEL
jgi:hypothetical protein